MRTATVEAVLKGGHADGRIMKVRLPLPLTVEVIRQVGTPDLVAAGPDPGQVLYEQVLYYFTGMARVTAYGEIVQAFYRAGAE